MSRAGWTQRLPATHPGDLYAAGMAYYGASALSVLFGGSPGVTFSDDTWTFDSATGEWTLESPSTVPDERAFTALAYDSNADVLVMFGGLTTGSVSLDDTWTWDGTDWTLQSPGSSPSARTVFGLAYDIANDRTVLFGGGAPVNASDETWTWDGSDWTLETPSSDPGGRRAPAMAYDAARGNVVMFGGDSGPIGTVLYDETWTWDGSDWTQESPAQAPSARRNATMVYDAEREVCILFGGIDAVGRPRDTWEWDGSEWAEVSTCRAPYGDLGVGLGGLEYPAMSFDPVINKAVLFGGLQTPADAVDRTWIYPTRCFRPQIYRRL